MPANEDRFIRSRTEPAASWGVATEASYDTAMLPSELAPGTIFAGDYRILRPLSSGGMGAVYVAEQLSTSKERALKLMRPELVANEDLRKRFEQEAKVGAKIASDHVVETIGAGVDAATGIPWLAMELLEGEDLFARIERVRVLDRETTRLIFEQLCHGLAAAHARKIVHRDLKPENVFLALPRRPGVPFTIKILDFGIAKTVQEADTKMTAALGTPAWMAPEQTEQGSSITPATDVWPLGLLAFLLLTGRLFWKSEYEDAKSTTMLLREMLLDPIVDASARVASYGAPELPPGFDDWFRRCVVRDPLARFPNAGEAYVAFAALFGVTATLDIPTSSMTPSVPRPSAPMAYAATAYVSGPLPASLSEPAPSLHGASIPPASRARTAAPVSRSLEAATPSNPSTSRFRVVGAVFAIVTVVAMCVLGLFVVRATRVRAEAAKHSARMRRLVLPSALRPPSGDPSAPSVCPCLANDRACMKRHAPQCPHAG